MIFTKLFCLEVMSDESLFPVSKLQCALANMNSHVKRKLIVLDCRIESMKTLQRKNRYVILFYYLISLSFVPLSKIHVNIDFEILSNNLFFRRYEENETFQDNWNVPIISEETLDKLTTMFTIYPE